MTGPIRNDPDALTQKDIDQLLKGAAPAAPAKPRAAPVEVVAYNFLRPPRISKERRIQLNSIFGRFALSMQSMMSSRLRTPMDVSCTIEQATFSEYILSIANPCAVFVYDLGVGEGIHGAIDLSTDLAFYMVDRAFGGPGDISVIDRGLTPLEQTVARGFAEKLLALFREAWQEHVPFAPVITGFESTPDMLQIAALEDNVLVANIEVRSGQSSSIVAMCIPLLALEKFLGDKASGRMPGRFAQVPGQRAVIEHTVRSAQVDLVARFPALRLSAREVAGLKVGQLIQTSLPIDGAIELHINGARRYLGHLGQYRRMLGLRVAENAPPMLTSRATRGRVT